jgi:hypothetical protein
MNDRLALITHELKSRNPDRFDLKRICRGFEQQLKFIDDPSKLKALFCTRRAAKSYTGGLYLVNEALRNESVNCLYIGLTRLSAKGIIWKDVLKDINKKNNLNIQFNGSELTATLSSNSIIYVTGADADEDEMDKLLGKKYKLVIIDEAASFTVDLRRLIYGILKPATVDQGGTVCLLGTSGNLTSGLFFDITTGREAGWKLFQWTAHDNPHVAKQWQDELDDIAVSRPKFMETPLFKQWYLNEWVIDLEKLVYRFSYGRNEYTHHAFHNKGWQFVLGVDLGYDPDPSAFVVVAFHEHDPCLYILTTFKQTEMDITDVAIKIKQFKTQFDIQRVVIDGANKQAVMEIQKRHDIGLTTADKTGKVDFIQIMNAEMIQEKIKLSADCQELKDEYLNLIWDDKSLKKQEHPNCDNHLCFILGTKIETPIGQVPIETLIVGDFVETTKGPRRIKATISRHSSVIVLNLSNGDIITCTPDHPFWSHGKWIKAEYLTKADSLYLWDELQNQKKFSFKIRNTIDRFIKNISERVKRVEVLYYIGRYGFSIMGRLKKDITSIIKTLILWITDFATWNASLHPSINASMHPIGAPGLKAVKTYSFWKESDLLQRNGTPQKRVNNGIPITEKLLSPTSMPNALGAINLTLNLTWQKINRAVALAAALPQSAGQVVLMILKEFVDGAKKLLSRINILSPIPVVYVVRSTIGISQKVYNITVEDQHEYFANGVLVSNCDAALYAWRFCYQFLSQKPKEKLDLKNQAQYIAHSKRLMDERIQKQADEDEAKERGDDIWNTAFLEDPTDVAHYFMNKRNR